MCRKLSVHRPVQLLLLNVFGQVQAGQGNAIQQAQKHSQFNSLWLFLRYPKLHIDAFAPFPDARQFPRFSPDNEKYYRLKILLAQIKNCENLLFHREDCREFLGSPQISVWVGANSLFIMRPRPLMISTRNPAELSVDEAYEMFVAAEGSRSAGPLGIVSLFSLGQGVDMTHTPVNNPDRALFWT